MQVLRRTYGTTATEKKKANLRPLLFTLETTPLWLVDDAILLVRRALVRMFLPTAGQLAVPFDRIVRSVLERRGPSARHLLEHLDVRDFLGELC